MIKPKAVTGDRRKRILQILHGELPPLSLFSPVKGASDSGDAVQSFSSNSPDALLMNLFITGAVEE